MARTALVVDDSMLIRHTVCRFLEERGFKVESATNGTDAVDLLSSFTPDIIITDLSMPKMNGSELISFIKGRQESSNTPIVVLAAKRTSTDTITETRADALIHKDIDIEDQLAAALDHVLQESRQLIEK
jgi:CheY-like chemotaxis protein